MKSVLKNVIRPVIAGQSSGEGVTDTDSDAFIARMGTAPSALLAVLINKTFVDLKSAGIYTSLVQFTKANIHNETDAKLNWIGNTFPIVPVGAPTWTAKKGWKATTNKYLKSGFIPATELTAGKIGENDCGLLTDMYENSGDLGSFVITGAFHSAYTSRRFSITTYSLAFPKCLGFLNSDVTGTWNQQDDIASPNGIFYVERNSNKMIGYANKIKTSDIDVANSTTTVDQEVFWGAVSWATYAAYFSNAYIRTMVICKYLGPTKQALLYDIIKYFNDNVGGTF